MNAVKFRQSSYFPCIHLINKFHLLIIQLGYPCIPSNFLSNLQIPVFLINPKTIVVQLDVFFPATVKSSIFSSLVPHGLFVRFLVLTSVSFACLVNIPQLMSYKIRATLSHQPRMLSIV
jgi:hypothetical protein